MINGIWFGYRQQKYTNMENSPTLESLPTLCRSATGRNHHFKMESHGNYKAASSVAHRRDTSYKNLL